MSYYESPKLYLETATSLKDRIVKLNSIITAMYDTIEKAALDANIDEYWLDDGQTKIKNIYRNPEDILKAVITLERLLQMYINRFNGRGTTLRDRESLIVRNGVRRN